MVEHRVHAVRGQFGDPPVHVRVAVVDGGRAQLTWLGLHGLAHQRAVSPAFRWPPGIAERVITALAHFTDDGAGRGR
ncbi:hypothetical protein [Streptomyces niveus]|uniref:hypothetical protein n=1 Tax=Streptomyces niveus TaxID=193462 RepID=UPI00343E13AF